MIDTDVLARRAAGAEPGRARRPAGDLHGARGLAPRAVRRAGRLLRAGGRRPRPRARRRRCRGRADGIRAAEPEALEDLAAALTLSGVSMGVAGRTAPGSGMEHTVSHLLEMADPASTALHGAKVGILSVLAALLWERVREAAPGRGAALPGRRVDGARACARRSRPSTRAGRWARSAGATTRASSRAGSAMPRRRWARWAGFDAEVGPLLAPAERLAGALAAAGAPLRLSELGIDAGTARWALAALPPHARPLHASPTSRSCSASGRPATSRRCSTTPRGSGSACDPGARVRRLRPGPRRHRLPRRRPPARRGRGDRRACAPRAPGSSS